MHKTDAIVIVILSTLFLISLVGTIVSLSGCGASTDDENIDLVYWIPADGTSGITGTGSMLPFLHKEDKMYYRELDSEEQLWSGRVYAFQFNESSTKLHRLISNYIGEDGKEYFIFKGDNSIRADKPVTRDKIERELIGVCFNGYCD